MPIIYPCESTTPRITFLPCPSRSSYCPHCGRFQSTWDESIPYRVRILLIINILTRISWIALILTRIISPSSGPFFSKFDKLGSLKIQILMQHLIPNAQTPTLVIILARSNLVAWIFYDSACYQKSFIDQEENLV